MKLKLNVFSSSTSTVLSVLNAALDGAFTLNLRASKKGMSIAINGKVIARGRDASELHTAFHTAVRTAKTHTP